MIRNQPDGLREKKKHKKKERKKKGFLPKTGIYILYIKKSFIFSDNIRIDSEFHSFR